MKKLFMVLCILIMFFGIAGCPSSDNPSTFSTSSVSSGSGAATPVAQIGDSQEAATSPVPEPATLVLLGAGLVGLLGVGRKKLFKKD